jgi:hypothetical protein
MSVIGLVSTVRMHGRVAHRHTAGNEKPDMTNNGSTWRVRAGVRLGAGVIAFAALAAGALAASASAAPAQPSPRTGLNVATIGGTLRGTTAAEPRTNPKSSTYSPCRTPRSKACSPHRSSN